MATVTKGKTFVSGETVTPPKLNDLVDNATVTNIVNADISNSAAIAGTKIAPDFGSQNVVTTGALLAGHTSAIATTVATGGAAVTPKSQVAGINIADSSVGLFNYSNVAGSSGQVLLSKSTSNAIGSHVAVSSGNRLGQIGFSGSDGTSFVAAALVRAEVDGTPSTNDMPGRLVFATTAGGASTTTERMRITSTGNVGIGTTTPNDAALLTLTSTTRGFLPPRMTTAQRDAISTPPAGLMIYNTTTNKLNVRTASSWEAVTSA
jgi:hypothetical protein